ncbi:MAG: transposase [Pirellula sp.]
MSRMTRAEVFNPNEVAVLHVIARVCRRCFLFGDDPITGKNFDHRKLWIEHQIKVQAAQFGIDILAFSLMENHIHQVLRSRPDVVQTWDDSEVARRWLMICPKRKDDKGNALEPTEAELDKVRNNPAEIEKLRTRLSDVSWWMRILCQKIGTRANREDQEVGKFFQGRFKAVRLLDEEAILACSVYVDLNPIRASIAESIENSRFTSGKLRFEAAKATSKANRNVDSFLAPVQIAKSEGCNSDKTSVSRRRCSNKGFLPISSLDYLQLLDLTARLQRSDKSGFSPSQLDPLMNRLGIELEEWRRLTKDFGRMFSQVAGKPQAIANARSLKTHRRFRMKRFATNLE